VLESELQVILGPGGLIRDVPENEELLEQIARTLPLPPADLLKLGAYYRAYSTNEPLGNHLALVGLLKLVNDPQAQQGLQEVLVRTAAAAGRSIGTPQDVWDFEDYFDFGCDDPNEGGSCLPFIRFIPFSNTNLGLLVETPHPKSHHKKGHFVIGIVPEPASVQPAKRTVEA